MKEKRKNKKVFFGFFAIVFLALAIFPLLDLFDFKNVALAESSNVIEVEEDYFVLEWKPMSWLDFYMGGVDFDGSNIWEKDGITYYSGTTFQLYLDGIEWKSMSWTGYSSIRGSRVWEKDGVYYYSFGSNQYYLDGTEWKPMSWTGYPSFNGSNIWEKDGVYYHSNGTSNSQYYLDGTEWKLMSWTGFNLLRRSSIWEKDGITYYSDGTYQYYLDGTEWKPMSWTGYTSLLGSYIWEKNGITYYSNGVYQYYLDGTEWKSMSWPGLSVFYGSRVWEKDGITYYSDGINQYYLQDYLFVGSGGSAPSEYVDGVDVSNDLFKMVAHSFTFENNTYIVDILGFVDSAIYYTSGAPFGQQYVNVDMSFNGWDFSSIELLGFPDVRIAKGAFDYHYYDQVSFVITPLLKIWYYDNGVKKLVDTLEIPDYIRIINDDAFAYYSFNNLVLNDGLLYLGSRSFTGLYSLGVPISHFYIPKTVYYIGSNVFKTLTTATIDNIYVPSSVRFIGEGAFGKVNNIHFLGSVPFVLLDGGNNSIPLYYGAVGRSLLYISNSANLVNYYVPIESLTVYKNQLMLYYGSSYSVDINLLGVLSDYYLGFEDGYEVGYEDGYDDGYEDGYVDIRDDSYNLGYEVGYSSGLGSSQRGYDGLFTLPASLLGTLLSTAYSWLNFTILGINIWNILMLLASVSFIIFLLKVFF